MFDVDGTNFKSHCLKHHTSNLKHLRKGPCMMEKTFVRQPLLQTHDSAAAAGVEMALWSAAGLMSSLEMVRRC